MAIQMRRGQKADFDPTKMLPGEWAVSIDSDTNNQIVWMCFRAGVVKRMGTYEDFKRQIEEATGEIKEEYLSEFQAILDQIEELAEQTSINTDTVVTIRNDIVNTYLPQMLQTLDSTSDNATLAESYAHGGTGTREGEDTDNAEYYYQQILKYPIKSANNLTTTEEGYVLDARQGKVLDDKISNLDYIALANSIGWKRASVMSVTYSDLGSVYMTCIASADYVANATYIIKLNNGSIHKVTARVVSSNQYGVQNGVVLVGTDVATATASGVQEDTTTGKKAWVTGASTGYTASINAPLTISTSSSVVAWYCKIDGTVKDLISSSSAITDTGQYALDAREKNASIAGTLAYQIDELNTNLSTILANGKFIVLGAVEDYSTLDTEIKKMSNGSFYLAYFPSGEGLIIGIKGSDLYQRQIKISYFNNNITSRLKANSSTWSEWTSI